MLKKSQSMVCFPNSLFCEDFDMMLCPNLMTMHIKGRYHALTQGIKTQFSTTTKKATGDKFTTKKKHKKQMFR